MLFPDLFHKIRQMDNNIPNMENKYSCTALYLQKRDLGKNQKTIHKKVDLHKLIDYPIINKRLL